MIEKVKSTIEKYKMLEKGERVCVALSGGADSIALTLALKELGYDVFCVHVNHNLRGEESDRDEAFCKSFCEENGLTLFVSSVDVKGCCLEKKLSLEEGARELRYQELSKLSCGFKIATAHNLNDNLETTLFNLTRGCGIKGLKGIPCVRDRLIRPLLFVSRSEIEAYLKEKGQDFVVDSTNLSDDCSRNIIRLNVIPELLKINPGLLGTYIHELSVFSSLESFFESETEKAFSESKTEKGYDLKIGSEALTSGVISKALNENGFSSGFDKIEKIKSIISDGGKVELEKGRYAIVKSEVLSFFDESENEKLFVEINGEGGYRFFDKTVIITKLSRFDISSYNNCELKYILDADKIFGSFGLRSYFGNEKIRLFKKDITQTVKKLIAKSENKNREAVLCDGQGPIFVEGFGVAERACADTDTKTAYRIEIINQSAR